MTADIKTTNFGTTQHWPDTPPARAVSEAQPKKTEKEQFDRYVEEGKLAWEKARKLIVLANEQDEFPGGIEASDLLEIYNAAIVNLPHANKSKSLESAQIYYRHAVATFQEMLGKHSGHGTVVERSKDIGCSYEYISIHGQFCPPGSMQEESSDLKITCADIGVEKTIKDQFVLCRVPPWNNCNCNDDHGHGRHHNTAMTTRYAVNPDQWLHCFCPIPSYER